MRISDWSSDVCSSDLIIEPMQTPWKPSVTVAAIIEKDGRFLLVEEETTDGLMLNNPAGHLDPGETPADGCVREALEESAYAFRDRKSVVSGKRVSVRVDLGGRRTNKKKKKKRR